MNSPSPLLPPSESDLNRRRWERCPIETPRGSAVLEVGSVKLPILLFDESPGGVGVLVKTPPCFWVDDVGRLKTGTSEYRVRVVYVARTDAESRATDHPPGEFRIGLECLEKLPCSPPPPEKPSLSRLVGIWISSLLPMERPSGILGICLASLLILTPILLTVMAWDPDAIAPARWIGWGHDVCGRVARVVHPTPVVSESPAHDGSRPGSSTSELRALVHGMAGIQPFLRPEVATALGLTPAQRSACRQLQETTQQALHEFDAYWGGEGKPGHAEKRAMIEDAARREFLRLLTDPQRQLWEQIREQ
jgi:hypothetical protein